MSKGGGQQMPSGSTTQTSTRELPVWATGTAIQALNRQNQLSQQNYAPFPYTNITNPTTGQSSGYRNIITGETYGQDANLPYQSTVAPLSSQTLAGLQGIEQKATAGNPVNANALRLSADTLAGNYLNPQSNPYLSATYDEAARKMSDTYLKSTVPQLNAAAQRAGAFGGSADALLKAEAMKNYNQSLGDLATNIYGGNYTNERNNQLKALALAPTNAAQNYADLNTLLGVGDVYNQYNQNKINDMLNQYNASTAYPQGQVSNLAQTLATLTNGLGTTTTTGNQSVYGPSLASQIMGGATSGAGLGLMASSLGASTPLSAALGFIPFLGSLFK